MTELPLAGKVAIVTGGGRGLRPIDGARAGAGRGQGRADSGADPG